MVVFQEAEQVQIFDSEEQLNMLQLCLNGLLNREEFKHVL